MLRVIVNIDNPSAQSHLYAFQMRHAVYTRERPPGQAANVRLAQLLLAPSWLSHGTMTSEWRASAETLPEVWKAIKETVEFFN